MTKMKMAAMSLALAATQALDLGAIFAGFAGTPYEVTITNLTQAQSFTPQLVATHRGSAMMFSIGEPASPGLESLAEGGDTSGVVAELGNRVAYSTTIDGLLGPGQSVTTTVMATGQEKFFSVAAMLLPTNDTFIAVNGARLPTAGKLTYMVPAYSAGTEAKDQDCVNVPGPTCGGEPGSDPAPDDEGLEMLSVIHTDRQRGPMAESGCSNLHF
ncbi:hypothetical protein A3709_11295 [Halioglobus sp. HI00S01]|uniref:spondin domain-containing protein n=1 Tax=Halioglobus sp. HI00S01 TaxID=1822214 RepID=UPI0007C275A7|nr:spondin domain-containing protein [Halioglobus sp. HI00S01]KZX50334.1 hypothetical protein A3709_11295 [Halioglobus sp. HI00S01]